MGILGTGSHDRELLVAATTYTRSITIPAGSGRRLVVGLAAFRFDIDNQVSITYPKGGSATALTLIAQTSSTPAPRVHIWEMLDPDVGTANLTITNTTNTNGGRWYWMWLDDTAAGAATGFTIESGSSTNGVPAATVGGTDVAVCVGFSLAGTGTLAGGMTSIATVNGSQGGYSTGAVPGYTYASANQLAAVTAVIPQAPPPGAFATGATLAATVAAGSLSAIASAFVGGATLGDIVAGGTLGPQPGVITSQPLRTNNGTLLASTALDYVDVYLEASGVFVGRFTGLSTNGSGVFTVTSALLTPGTAYKLDWRATGGQRRMPVATAA
jgi:hypothetical protein